MATNYSILVDVELQTKQAQQQLKNAFKNTKVTIDSSDMKDLTAQTNKATESVEDLGLTFQQANLIMQKSLDIIASMVEQVYELDGAITEFKKVSDLSGTSLDKYVDKLSKMGSQVARTGKPKRQAPCVGIVNQHKEPLEIQYSLRAYSTTMVA